MKLILQRLIHEPGKSFIVFHEKEPYFTSPWHHHPEYELVLILKSTGKRIIGDHEGRFEPGDLVLIGSKLPHVYTNDEAIIKGEIPGGAEAIVIQFLPDFLGGDFFDAPEASAISALLKKSDHGLNFRGEKNTLIMEEMKKMPGLDILDRLISLINILTILAESNDYSLLSRNDFSGNKEHYTSHKSKLVTEYIQQNFKKDIPIERISKIADMTPANFCTYFKSYYRQTFAEYLNKIRIGHAGIMLEDADKTISEIAYECGFNNLSTFNRLFKKIHGASPTSYRESIIPKTI